MKQPLCLLRPDKAGDALKTLPVIRALRASGFSQPIYVFGSVHNFSLFSLEPQIQAYQLPSDWEKLSNQSLTASLSQQIKQPIHNCISLLCDPNETSERLLQIIPAKNKFSAATNLSLPGKGPEKRSEILNIALLVDQALSANSSDYLDQVCSAPKLSFADLEEAQAQNIPPNSIGFCPFAGLKHRSLPLSRWCRLLKWIIAKREYAHYFIFGSPSDHDSMKWLLKQIEVSELSLCFPTSFRAMGAYFKLLDAVVAVDSGPLHLAHSLNVRSLGFLSGGDHQRWFPMASGFPQVRHKVLKRGLFGRFPSAIEMLASYKHWRSLTN